ncbi:MAG: hypothetical protein QOH05_979 [Acetobacteraceae bacterium]|jgi:hypothetical protein|nr:hypothetical protein [Acetobacteraceae bacterium]
MHHLAEASLKIRSEISNTYQRIITEVKIEARGFLACLNFLSLDSLLDKRIINIVNRQLSERAVVVLERH